MDAEHQDTVQLLRDETNYLADALQRHDVNAAASALATIAQAVHQAQLHVDPEGLATAALTHQNGEYVGRSAFSGQ